MQDDDTIVVGDKRRSQFFLIHSDIFDKWGKRLGPNGIAVYLCLIRHSGNYDDKCLPFIKTIADECGISRKTVMRTLKRISELGLIEIQPRKSEHGGDTSNLYIIKDIFQ